MLAKLDSKMVVQFREKKLLMRDQWNFRQHPSTQDGIRRRAQGQPAQCLDPQESDEQAVE